MNPIYYGAERPLPEARPLRAGPLTMLLEEGGLRYVRWGNQEILRRVYGAVRDRNWDTVPATVSDLDVQAGDDSFRATFVVDCRQREVDYRWKGTIEGGTDGTVRFTMDGEARSKFLRNRIGLCVLHPIRECAGKTCVVEHANGAITRKGFPRYVWPHQPFKSVRAIAHEVAPGLRAKVRMDGDVFEMEDQRNWSDASFKTYSTPLELPFPVELPKGSGIVQTVTLSLEGNVAPPATPAPGPVIFSLEKPVAMPRLGFQAPPGQPLTPPEIDLLRPLAISHLRVDLRGGHAGWKELLAKATEDARALGAALEIAVHLREGAPELKSLGEALAALKPAVDRVLVFHLAEKSVAARWVRETKEKIGPLAGEALIGGGTDAYFAEVNRGEHPPECEVVAYSVNPQVHAFDTATLVENLEGQGYTVESARLLPGERPIAVTPVTFLPRMNPNATEPGTAAEEFDPRQRSLFGAAWTAASLKYVSEAGAASATYFDARGVLAVPLYQVFADVGEFAGGQVVRSRSSRPLEVDGLALRKGPKTRLLLANFWPEPKSVRVQGLSGGVAVRMLDERYPHLGDPETRQTSMGRLELELPPCGIARIDA